MRVGDGMTAISHKPIVHGEAKLKYPYYIDRISATPQSTASQPAHHVFQTREKKRIFKLYCFVGVFALHRMTSYFNCSDRFHAHATLMASTWIAFNCTRYISSTGRHCSPFIVRYQYVWSNRRRRRRRREKKRQNKIICSKICVGFGFDWKIK